MLAVGNLIIRLSTDIQVIRLLLGSGDTCSQIRRCKLANAVMQRTLFGIGVKQREPDPSELPVSDSNSFSDTTIASTVNLERDNSLQIELDQHKDQLSNKNHRGRTARVVTVKKWNCDWLEYEEKDGLVKIWCKYCREFPDVAQGRQHRGQKQFVDCEAYINGTNNVKRCTVQHHEKSDGHMDARKASMAKY